MAENQNLRSFQNFQQNMKKTALGVKFGKKLFTDPHSLKEETIAQAFKALGLKIPEEVKLTIEMAQLISTGQAAIDTYNTASDMAQIADMSSGMVSSFVSIASRAGWIEDKDGDVATTVTFLADVAALIGSCGADARAWASLAMSGYVQNEKNKMIAQNLAQKGVYEGIQNYLRPQQVAFGNNLKELQEKKIGILGFITKNAMQAPSIFAVQFKDQNFLKGLPEGLRNGLIAIPTYDVRFEARATASKSFIGMGDFFEQSATASQVIQTIGKIDNPDLAREFIFSYLIEPNIYSYYVANEYFKRKDNITIENLSIAYGLGCPIDFISDKKDYSFIYEYLGVSPSEMNQFQAIQYIDSLKYQYDLKTSKVFNDLGIDYGGYLNRPLVKKDPNEDRKKLLINNASLIKSLDQYGRVSELVKIREIKEVLSKSGYFEPIPGIEETSSIDRGGKVVKTLKPFGNWRKIQNYVVSLQYLELVQNDPYYYKWESERFKKYEFYKTFDLYQQRVDEIFKLNFIRSINKNALGNVAYFLNTDVKNLKRKNTEKGPGIYGIKGG